MDQNTTTVLTTLIVAGSPLIALYLGIVLGRKQEDRKWKKERILPYFFIGRYYR